MKTVTFEDLVGDPQVFFSQYFNRKPLLRRGALADRVGDLLTVRQLDDVMALEAVQPSYVRLAKSGVPVPHKAYTRTLNRPGAVLSDVLVPENIYELFRTGSTVTWNSVNHFLPSVRRLLDSITAGMAAPGEVVAFLTPARNEGFSPHHDPVDVFVVQIEGTKAWRLWDTPAERDGGRATFTEEQIGEPAVEVTLEPGDVLYMPYNTPHAAAAREEVSLHLSVTIEPRRWRDLLRETVDRLVQDSEFDEFPHLGDGLSVESARRLADKFQLLSARLAAIDPTSEARRLASGPGGSGGPAGQFARLSAVDGLRPGTPVRRSTLPISLTPGDGTRTGLLVNGHRLAVPDAVAGALRELEAGGSMPAADVFPGAPEDRALRAAQGLARIGVLEPADTTRSHS
jgi:ribosomal protein L16 Arg81 hydroxylase